ncbi:hypothetical protein M406DRAFT_61302 [Cryphonectria parasitica EP155]|uniref:Sulphur transport domain-containing protein n=1 Tax=Cryphonectria parasitica (strain ATCC 38755 / EP155) TaxID=660469 RepID=A0A9P5CQC7_CRYP1|nr:uncharacterized protein M406DRAFT_61302 [Cryphonectria parasitica EP155]KAF3767389.1 hypothetical protein M406DRAFT_61302 [Cryphonectria parasitica EP155]
MDTIITGSAFGASLAASGMYEPYLIASQFTLQKWNMVQTFLTATGCSALTIELLRRLGHPVPPPRSWSPTGITGSPIDGNVLGGLLLGAGMSLSSSCPGMVFPQIALGIPSAPAIIAGASVGGICWSAVLRPWIAARRKQTTITNTTPPPEVSLAGFLGTRHTTALVAYGTALATIVAVVALRMPSASSPLHPVTGGLVIGAAQAVSLLLRGSLLGVSTCYEQLGDWIVWLARGRRQARPGSSAVLFAAAMAAGTWLLARLGPGWVLTETAAAGVMSPAKAFAGGFLMAVGSRMAGGCASGHGISGMALMSMSSLVTMACVFAAAIGVSRVTGV